MRVTVFIATSLDGFIAGPKGEIDWLNEASEQVTEGDDLGFGELMASVDTLVMGRKTYEQVLSFGAWPYGETPVVVLSGNKLNIPEELGKKVTHSSESPRVLYDRLLRQGKKHIYIDGGITIQGFLKAKLITDFTITLIPVLLGEGIPLVGDLEQQIKLELTGQSSNKDGFVQLNYTPRYLDGN